MCTGTRNKIIRTCDNCRKRKIKCDRKRPACSACHQRRLLCEYNGRSNKGKERRLPSDQDDNLPLLSDLNNPSNIRAEDQDEEFDRKTFRSLNYIRNKNGRVNFYGPTSFRNVIYIMSLETYFMKFWSSLKEVRQKWKEEHEYLSFRRKSANFTHMPLCLITSGSILEALCACLPNFDKIVEVVKMFFESEFFISLPFIDPNKIYQYLNSFQLDEFRIASLKTGSKDNIYQLAIITEILSVVYFRDKVPTTVELFHNIVLSSIDGKSSFLEKVQFLMLRYFVHKIEGVIHPDDTSLRNLVNMAYVTATDIGLHQTENYLYFKDDSKHLSTLWAFMLFADFEVSFSAGCPLHISEGTNLMSFYQTSTENVGPEDSLLVFVNRILFLREVITELYGPTTISDLEAIIYKLKLFYIKTFGPIIFNIVSEQNTVKDFKVLILKLSTLQIISNLSLISLGLQKKTSYELKRNTYVCQFSSIKLLVDNLRTYLYSFKMLNKDLLNVKLFGLSYSFHSIGPRTAVDLFSVIMKAAIFEKFHHQLSQKKYAHCHNITDFENILKGINFLHIEETENHIDCSTALELLQTIYSYFWGCVSSQFLEVSSYSYISRINTIFIPSIKIATETLLKDIGTLDEDIEKESNGSIDHSPLPESFFDFMFEDLLF